MSDVRMPTVVWRGETIPLLVLGTAQLGLPGYGIANRTDGMDQERGDAIVKTAWESGVRFFDTAQGYGDSEERLGQAFVDLGIGDTARVITKLAPGLDPADPLVIGAALRQSLSRLRIDCLWGVMLHRFSWLEQWEKGLGGCLEKFRDSGKIRYIGVSVYSPDETLAAIEYPGIDIVQVPTNAWNSSFIEGGFFERAKEVNKLLFVRSIFLQGLLLLSLEEAEEKVPGAGIPAEKWHGICQQYGLSPRTMALAWVSGLKMPLVVGAETPEQIAQVAGDLIDSRLSREQRSTITKIMIEADASKVADPRSWTRPLSREKGQA